MKKIDIFGIEIYSNMTPEAILRRLKNRLPDVYASLGTIWVRKDNQRIVLQFKKQNTINRLAKVYRYPLDDSELVKPEHEILYCVK